MSATATEKRGGFAFGERFAISGIGSEDSPTLSNGERVALGVGWENGRASLAEELWEKIEMAATVDARELREFLRNLRHPPNSGPTPDYVYARAGGAVEGKNGAFTRDGSKQ